MKISVTGTASDPLGPMCNIIHSVNLLFDLESRDYCQCRRQSPYVSEKIWLQLENRIRKVKQTLILARNQNSWSSSNSIDSCKAFLIKPSQTESQNPQANKKIATRRPSGYHVLSGNRIKHVW